MTPVIYDDRISVADATHSEEPAISTLMSEHVVFIARDMTLDEVQSVFAREHIAAAPVLDEDGKPVGVISNIDLLLRSASGDDGDAADLADDLTSAASITVSELRLPQPVCLSEETTASRAATVMTFEDVHRIIVVDAMGRASGILTSLDLLAALPRFGDEMQLRAGRRARLPNDAHGAL